MFNYPWLYAVEVGHWELTDAQVAKFREFLTARRFLHVRRFPRRRWNGRSSCNSMKKVFPDRPIVDIADDDPIFHTVFDLDERYQVPGMQYVYSHQLWEKDSTGTVPHWRGIYDDHGRIMVAICHNMDLGDSWENADEPSYDQRFSALGIRLGVDYITYAMSH